MFTVANEGIGDLSGVVVSVTGAHSGDFTLQVADLPVVIHAGQWATIGVTFVPGGEGVRSATLHISSNDADEGELDIALVGSGIVVPPPFVQKAYMKAATSGGFQFGQTIAMSGDTLVSTASYSSDMGAGELITRAVNIFTRSGNSWSQQTVSTPPLSQEYERGGSGAISGDILLIGAPGESNLAGAVYVFVRNGNQWTQEARLVASNPDPGDLFGITVAISGETAVISAPGEDSQATGVNGDQSDNSAPGTGAVYVFTRVGGVWSQQCYFKPQSGGRLWNATVSGDTIAAGGGSVVDGYAGEVYVFSRNGGVWSQQAFLKGFNTDQDDGFGGSVSLAGDTLAVGALGEAGTSTGVNGAGVQSVDGIDSGAAYIFTRSGTTWTQEAYLKPSTYVPYIQFGNVCVEGDTVVVGALSESSNALGVNGNQTDSSATESGAAYVFSRSGGTWTQRAYLKASNGNSGDIFGTGVAISGQTVVVSASHERSDATGINGNQANDRSPNGIGAGAVYVFTASNPASAIQHWSAFAGLAGADASPAATPFGDGIPNLLKFAFNMNGGGPDVSRLQPGTGFSGLPFVGLAGEGAALMLRVEFVRRKNSGLIYTPKRSNTLAIGSFLPMTGTPVVTPIPFTDDQWERVVIEEPADPSVTPRSFVTVEVTVP